MHDDPLETLLQRADRTAIPPVPPADLARRVRARAARRRVVFGGLSTAAAVVALAIGAWSFVPRAGEPAPVEPVVVSADSGDVAALRAELDRLRKEVKQREAVIKIMIAERDQRQRLVALRREIAAPLSDPRTEIDQQVEQAAQALVARANRLLVKLERPDSAAAGYRRVVELYPRTSWAAVARQRLSQIETKDPT